MEQSSFIHTLEKIYTQDILHNMIFITHSVNPREDIHLLTDILPCIKCVWVAISKLYDRWTCSLALISDSQAHIDAQGKNIITPQHKEPKGKWSGLSTCAHPLHTFEKQLANQHFGDGCKEPSSTKIFSILMSGCLEIFSITSSNGLELEQPYQ